ncbi:MAG: hypothetical protein WKG07_46055 [Hymenobacter sp.]
MVTLSEVMAAWGGMSTTSTRRLTFTTRSISGNADHDARPLRPLADVAEPEEDRPLVLGDDDQDRRKDDEEDDERRATPTDDEVVSCPPVSSPEGLVSDGLGTLAGPFAVCSQVSR